MIIPSIIPITSKGNFTVPQLPSVISYDEFALESAIFGTGIKAAEVNANSQKLLKQNQLDTIPRSNGVVIPDAEPDGNGGYLTASPNGVWDGRMSSVLNGMPVMCHCHFVGTSYRALNGQIITIPDIDFETVVITLKQGKNIEKTDITGRDTGSVKEYIGQKDWVIEIRAVITDGQRINDTITGGFNQDGVYPETAMEAIDFLISAPIAIKVDCWYLNKRGINYVVIDDGVQINQVEGEYEMQRIVIPCLSDNPLIITVAQPLT